MRSPGVRYAVCFLSLLLMAVSMHPPAARAAGTLDPATINETVFPNGLRLLIKEAHAVNLVAIQYWVRTGGFQETDQTRGAAHFIEHLIFKGTDRYPQGGIDAEIEDLGGVLSATTEKDWVMFGTTVASQHVGKALEVLGDALRHPKFRQTDLETERGVIVDEIHAQNLEPDRVIAARLFQKAYSQHPYRYDVMGTPDASGRVNRATVQQFFADHYTPSNATLVIVGDVSPPELLPKIKAAFGVDVTPGSPLPLKLPPMDPFPAATRETLPSERQQAFYGIGFRGPAVSDPEVHATDVLVTMLEQGTFGRLPAALSGSASSVKATFETRRQPGMLTVIVATSPADLPKVEATVLGVLRDLATNPPDERELLATKSVLAGSYETDNETFAGQASTLGYYASIDRWQFATDYLKQIARVTPAQVREAAAMYLTMDHAVTVLMRPSGAPPGQRQPGAGQSEARR